MYVLGRVLCRLSLIATFRSTHTEMEKNKATKERFWSGGLISCCLFRSSIQLIVSQCSILGIFRHDNQHQLSIIIGDCGLGISLSALCDNPINGMTQA